MASHDGRAAGPGVVVLLFPAVAITLVGLDRPLQLELDLLLVVVALVLDRELGPLGHPETLAGDLDAERLVLFEGVGQPTKLGHHLRGGIDALKISRRLRHRSTPSLGVMVSRWGGR